MNDTTFQGDGKVAYVPVVVNTKMTKPQTNADRIRAMTDEELAFYIVNHPMWSDESACAAWLKEPITGGESENPN